MFGSSAPIQRCAVRKPGILRRSGICSVSYQSLNSSAATAPKSNPAASSPLFMHCRLGHGCETVLVFRAQRAQQLAVSPYFAAITDQPERVPHAGLGGGDDRLADLALEPLDHVHGTP